MPNLRFCIYTSVLTNGTDVIELEPSRTKCNVEVPYGMIFSIVNGEYYINGKKAWIQVKEVQTENIIYDEERGKIWVAE